MFQRNHKYLIVSFGITLMTAMLSIHACALPPAARQDPNHTENPTVIALEKYENATYNFAFEYPAGIVITEEAKGPFQVQIHAEPESPFQIRARKEYSVNEPKYFLDTAPNGQITLGEITWHTFQLPDGYQDATGKSLPIYALQTELDSILYTVVIYNQDALTPVQINILSTFRVID